MCIMHVEAHLAYRSPHKAQKAGVQGRQLPLQAPQQQPQHHTRTLLLLLLLLYSISIA
jgi:hypothetical protein